MSKIKNPLSREKWAALKAIQPPPGRFIHVSVSAEMVALPEKFQAPKAKRPSEAVMVMEEGVPVWKVPLIQEAQGTMDIGSRKLKGFERAIKAQARKDRKAGQAGAV